MKRIISVFLILCTVFSLGITASANKFDDERILCEYPEQINVGVLKDNINSNGNGIDTGLITNVKNIHYATLSDSDVLELKTKIETALLNKEESLDVQKYNIPVEIVSIYDTPGEGYYDYDSDKDELVLNGQSTGDYSIGVSYSEDVKNIIQQIFYSHPELFCYYSHSFNFYLPESISEEHSFVTMATLFFIYYDEYDDGARYNSDLAFCDEKINEIVSKVTPAFNDLEKVVFVHDYLVNNFFYDLSDTYGNMYYFLSRGGGVCQSYALTFKAVMDKLGIENTTAVSEECNHIWNIVKIDGKYYHVDCTQDDPIFITDDQRYDEERNRLYYSETEYDLCSDSLGTVLHKYLLLNDTEIVDDYHSTWYTVPSYGTQTVCNSYAFSNASFKTDTAGPLNYYNGYWYAVSDSLPTSIYRFNSGTFANKTTLGTTTEAVTNKEYKLNPHDFCNRGSVMIGNEIYFTDVEVVAKYNVSTNTFKQVFIKSDMPSDIMTSGCYLKGNGELGFYYRHDYQNKDNNSLSLDVGDINRDGYFNAADLLILKDFVLGKNTNGYDSYFADSDYSGDLDILDIILLKKQIASLL